MPKKTINEIIDEPLRVKAHVSRDGLTISHLFHTTEEFVQRLAELSREDLPKCEEEMMSMSIEDLWDIAYLIKYYYKDELPGEEELEYFLVDEFKKVFTLKLLLDNFIKKSNRNRRKYAKTSRDK
jgi:hypothetical protein